MPARCAASPTDCSPSPAQCWKARPRSSPTSGARPVPRESPQIPKSASSTAGTQNPPKNLYKWWGSPVRTAVRRRPETGFPAWRPVPTPRIRIADRPPAAPAIERQWQAARRDQRQRSLRHRSLPLHRHPRARFTPRSCSGSLRSPSASRSASTSHAAAPCCA